MNEEQTRAMIRGEIRAAFQLLEDAARNEWRNTSSESVEEYCSEMIRASAESVVESLTTPGPVAQDDQSLAPCQHIYKSCENAQGNGGASCVLCYEREPDPVNPFAPKRTAWQWAADIRTLIEQAQNDGHEVWFDATYQISSDNLLSLRVGPDDTAPYIWGETK